MHPDSSVSHWLTMVQAGDPRGAQKLWERYYQQMVRLARTRLRGAAPGLADEEDVALSAFASFCRHAERGRYPKLADRDDLWRLLVLITARKTHHLLRDANRLKRGGEWLQEDVNVEQLIGAAPTPEFAAQCADECRALFDRLGDSELVRIAIAKMEGHTNEEIAQLCDRAPRTIERKLQLIRKIWERADP
jgi:DNA-directed RNA polymerase specialized sigma24 family protein